MRTINIEDRTLRVEATHRGGGIEIHLENLNKNKYSGYKMTAYQNYLGGGMLGSIQNDCNYPEWRDDKYLIKLSEQLAEYFHSLTNHEDDEWESATFEQNQLRPSSAY